MWRKFFLWSKVRHNFWNRVVQQQLKNGGTFYRQFSMGNLMTTTTTATALALFLGLPSWFLVNKASMASTTNPTTTITTQEVKKSLPSTDIVTQKQILKEMREIQKDSSTPVYRIVLTGGPCGGKSTAVSTISDLLLELGFKVFRVPEAATLVITGTGLLPWVLQEEEGRVFEGSIMKTKIALEDIFYNIAKAGNQPAVIICDRGTMDTRAYLKKEDWEVLLDEFGWNVVDLRDKRYDAVIHMVTAAIGAEKFYTTENNAARSENLQQARDLDFKVLNAWVGHPRIRIIDNSTDFQRKIQRVEEVICQIVGTPLHKGVEHKYIVSEEIPDDIAEKLGLKIETYQVEKTYLQKNNQSKGYDFIRRRGQGQTYTYTHSMLRQSEDETDDIDFAILERAISGREYVTLSKNVDPTRCTIVKRVQCFTWENVYYQLQTIIKPEIGLSILKTEVEADKVIKFPSFLSIEGEITGKKEFSAHRIAKEYTPESISNWKENKDMARAYEQIRWKKTEE